MIKRKHSGFLKILFRCVHLWYISKDPLNLSILRIVMGLLDQWHGCREYTNTRVLLKSFCFRSPFPLPVIIRSHFRFYKVANKYFVVAGQVANLQAAATFVLLAAASQRVGYTATSS